MSLSRQRLPQYSRRLADLKGRCAQPLTPAAAPAGFSLTLAKKNWRLHTILDTTFEAKYWLDRASARNLMPAADAQESAEALNSLARQLNAFVNELKAQKRKASNKPSKTREGPVNYETPADVKEKPFLNEDDLQWLS